MSRFLIYIYMTTEDELNQRREFGTRRDRITLAAARRLGRGVSFPVRKLINPSRICQRPVEPG